MSADVVGDAKAVSNRETCIGDQRPYRHNGTPGEARVTSRPARRHWRARPRQPALARRASSGCPECRFVQTFLLRRGLGYSRQLGDRLLGTRPGGKRHPGGCPKGRSFSLSVPRTISGNIGDAVRRGSASQ
jgi:hypothetical protein